MMKLLTPTEVRRILDANGCNQDHVQVLAIRGADGSNDRRVYDDYVYVWSPDGVVGFKHNTDPNGYRNGHGKGDQKGMAMLAPGIHIFGTGLHRGKLAFRQCEVFTVIRDGKPPYRDTGWHAIDWHSGSMRSTSSLGCQTNPPDAWSVVRPLVYKLLEKFNNPKRQNDRGEIVRSFNYVLLPFDELNKGNIIVSRRYLDS